MTCALSKAFMHQGPKLIGQCDGAAARTHAAAEVDEEAHADGGDERHFGGVHDDRGRFELQNFMNVRFGGLKIKIGLPDGAATFAVRSSDVMMTCRSLRVSGQISPSMARCVCAAEG